MNLKVFRPTPPERIFWRKREYEKLGGTPVLVGQAFLPLPQTSMFKNVGKQFEKEQQLILENGLKILFCLEFSLLPPT